MSDNLKPAFRHFTAFQSAAEEATDKEMRDRWINEGGQFLAQSGRVIQALGSEKPYKAILILEDGDTTERYFDTMRDAETFICRSTPKPAVRDTSRDESPGRS